MGKKHKQSQAVAAIASMQWFFPPQCLNSHSHAPYSHSHHIAIVFPLPSESYGTHRIPVFLIPMHISTEPELIITIITLNN